MYVCVVRVWKRVAAVSDGGTNNSGKGKQACSCGCSTRLAALISPLPERKKERGGESVERRMTTDMVIRNNTRGGLSKGQRV